jgi:hypothetical protein
MDTGEKIRENRSRRKAERLGLRLEKSRRRDPQAITYGTYQLVNPSSSTLECWGSSEGYGMSLSEIEKALNDYATTTKEN